MSVVVVVFSKGGRKPSNNGGFGLGKQGYKVGMYKDDNETEDDFNNPLLSKPGFPQRPSDRDVSSYNLLSFKSKANELDLIYLFP